MYKHSAFQQGATWPWLGPAWPRSRHAGRMCSAWQQGATQHIIAPRCWALPERVNSWNSFARGLFCEILSVYGQFRLFCRFLSSVVLPAYTIYSLANSTGVDPTAPLNSLRWYHHHQRSHPVLEMPHCQSCTLVQAHTMLLVPSATACLLLQQTKPILGCSYMNVTWF